MRGAARSEGGKPIIALRSVTADGKKSRITARLRPGSGVVTTRADVHYVVTEFGIAYLHGKSVRERALALIHIAHPDFRGELMRQACERHLVHPHQIAVPAGVRAYPKKYETTATFGGQEIVFRPVQPTDERLVKELFYSHSRETVLNRYFTPLRHLSREQVQKFVMLDYFNDMAIVGLVPFEGRQRMLCVGRYFRDPLTNDAEIAVTIHDDFQKQGIGTYLMNRLIQTARDSGIGGFTADVKASNQGMLRLFRNAAKKVDTRLENQLYHLRFGFDQLRTGK